MNEQLLPTELISIWVCLSFVDVFFYDLGKDLVDAIDLGFLSLIYVYNLKASFFSWCLTFSICSLPVSLKKFSYALLL